jgi:eukaryotic-like serine/threonine-protein kinase
MHTGLVLQNGMYTVEELIGSGSMGSVYAGRDRAGRRCVAIKFLHDHFAQDQEVRVRFNRESKLAKLLRSPYVAQVLDAGQNRQGYLWIAFDLLAGESLDRVLRRHPILDFATLRWLLDNALRGLVDAHKRGVIHRDIKPGNIFLAQTSEGSRAMLLDFGVSKLAVPHEGISDQALTATGETLGSLNFMAPEQIGGAANVDTRADLYALGVTGFYALTGTFPFVGVGQAAAYNKRMHPPLTLRAQTNQPWPDDIEQFFAHLLARNPHQRFPTAEQALDALSTLQSR